MEIGDWRLSDTRIHFTRPRRGLTQSLISNLYHDNRHTHRPPAQARHRRHALRLADGFVREAPPARACWATDHLAGSCTPAMSACCSAAIYLEDKYLPEHGAARWRLGQIARLRAEVDADDRVRHLHVSRADLERGAGRRHRSRWSSRWRAWSRSAATSTCCACSMRWACAASG